MLEIFTRSPSTILNLQVSREVLQIGLLINLHFCYDMLTKHFITDTSLQNKIVEIISVAQFTRLQHPQCCKNKLLGKCQLTEQSGKIILNTSRCH